MTTIQVNHRVYQVDADENMPLLWVLRGIPGRNVGIAILASACRRRHCSEKILIQPTPTSMHARKPQGLFRGGKSA